MIVMMLVLGVVATCKMTATKITFLHMIRAFNILKLHSRTLRGF